MRDEAEEAARGEGPFGWAGPEMGDGLLKGARVAAWGFGQSLATGRGGESRPYNEKTSPRRAVEVLCGEGGGDVVDVFLDPEALAWDSRCLVGGRPARLPPDEMGRFFRSGFYSKALAALASRWPVSDPEFGRLFDACVRRRMLVPAEAGEAGLEEAELQGRRVMPGKRADLANKDVTGDGARDYSSTGRPIQTFGDMGVKGGSGRYWCWPDPERPFKWSQWRDWEKIKPLCKMTFVHDSRPYMISISPYDENFENRGFRGADLKWEPPLAWLTPGECEQVMKLNVVRKFVRQCIKRIVPYVRMKARDVWERIGRPDKVSLEQVRKTQRVVKGVLDTALRKNKADNYRWE